MTPEQFKSQVIRLQSRFGEKAFDNEFVKLVWREVDGMNYYDFVKVVETFIGARSHHKAPLLSEFREQRLLMDKNRVERDAQGACRILRHPSMVKPISEILNKEYGGGVDSVAEAFTVAKLRMLKGNGDEPA